MYKYKFNISGGFDDMGAVMATFVEKKNSPLTYDLIYTVDSIVWGNQPEPSFDQWADVVVTFNKSLSERRLADFKALNPDVQILLEAA